MKSTSHFFLSMAHNALADECLVRSDRDHADEADVHLKEVRVTMHSYIWLDMTSLSVEFKCTLGVQVHLGNIIPLFD